MTPERKAELRRLAKMFAVAIGRFANAIPEIQLANAIPELLDELETLEAEATAHRKALSDICTAVVPSAEDREYHVNEIIAAIMAGAESYARADSLAAQLAACQKQAAVAYQAQARQNRDEVELAGHLGMEAAVNQAVEQIAAETARANSLAALVVRLREALLDNALALGPDGVNPMCGFCNGQPWPTGHKPNCDTGTVLADTEAAATTWLEADRREQRLAGARALLDRLETADFDDRAFYQATQRLEAMRREARQ